MKTFWLPFAVVLFALTSCAPDQTLETLIPRHSLAVVLVDHPSQVLPALGDPSGFPLAAVDAGKPWAGAVVPANPPGFLLALALADQPRAWDEVSHWATDRGGLVAVKVGTYAVLSSPGLPEAGVLDPDARFDLTRVRAGGDPVAVYIDIHNVMQDADFPEAFRPMFAVLPWAEKNLSGLRLGLNAKDGGLEVRLATDWKAGSEGASAFRGWSVPSDPRNWAGLIPLDQGVGLVGSLPPVSWSALGPWMGDPALEARWASLAPLLGPRTAAAVSWGDQGVTWVTALETQDPQAVRQALKTLVAGGDLQRNFGRWSWDPDTALIYRDTPDQGGVRTVVHVGPNEVLLTYGTDRVVVASGPQAAELMSRWKKTPASPNWLGQAPPGASVLAAGAVDGLGAKAALRVLGDGNVEARVWVDVAGLKTWQERLPQALLGWLSGEGGLTRWEP